ncbi:MAG: hypothetical protein QG639_542 [Patescibacteria group bacterium]|jgi:hypothetical protein|nr:hypothetical protein [Patescibacteria group bacterium]
MKKLVIAALFVIGAVAVATSTANATTTVQEQHQEASIKFKNTCNPKTTVKTGAYGETETTTEGNCEFEGKTNLEQHQRQEILGDNIVLKDNRGGLYHAVADTALDTKSMVAAMGLLVTGGLAYVAKRSIA